METEKGSQFVALLYKFSGRRQIGLDLSADIYAIECVNNIHCSLVYMFPGF